MTRPEGISVPSSRISGNMGDETMTKKQAVAWVRAHDDDDEIDEDELVDVFTALYERKPTQQDIDEGLWSHCCASIWVGL